MNRTRLTAFALLFWTALPACEHDTATPTASPTPSAQAPTPSASGSPASAAPLNEGAICTSGTCGAGLVCCAVCGGMYRPPMCLKNKDCPPCTGAPIP